MLFNAEKYGDQIRSLSVQLGQDIRDKSTDSWTYETSLERRLNSIIPVISKCTNLASFSLRIERHSSRLIPRPRIVALLNSLPDTCRNLEFDTIGQDYADEMKYAHVCDAIRRLLPRLEHARIRLATMCTTMFGSDDVETIALPKLKSLVVNFGSPHDMQTAHCDQEYGYDYIEDEEEESNQAFPSCVGALVNLAQNLKQVKIYAVLPAMAFDKWKHEDHIRRLDTDNKPSYWDWDLDTVVTYHRPRPMSFEKWRQANPNEGVSKQLKNEELVGMKLVKAEIRRGDGWLDGRPIVKTTPGGWRRNGYGILQKI